MGTYGNHPTGFSGLSDQKLFSLYRFENWSRMSESQKVDLYQETVNRHAALLGEDGAPKVCVDKMDHKTVGTHARGVITLNRDIVIDGLQTAKFGDHYITYQRDDAGMQAMVTCFHENIHAWQDQCLDGTIQCRDPELLKEYRANDFDINVVSDLDGTMKMGTQYLNGDPGGRYYMYYLQSTERDAHRESERLAVHVMDQLENIYGTEEGFRAFREELEVNGYEATLEEAKRFHQNPEIERDINQTLMNAYYGTDVPVDPDTKRAVEREMIVSCNETYHIRQQKQELSLGEDGGFQYDGTI